MAIDPDPYRTLGLARGASREEIRRAYRKLAKIHHPDAAGPGALPRFLAIHAAYEQLILRSGGRTGRTASGRAAPPRRAWEADPDRTDATRRAYGGRSRTSGTNGANGTDRPSGTSGASGTSRSTPPPGEDGRPSAGWRARSSQRTGARPAGGKPAEPGQRPKSGSAGTSPPGGRGEGRRRNKATLGSTSYDDAGPFEPDWAGASWYGTTSGTYWTVNPKEYADPRKHGPEYQARARRASRVNGTGRATPGSGPSSEGIGDDAASPATGPFAEPLDAASSAEQMPPEHDSRAADATHTTSSWWTSTAGSEATTGEPAPADPGMGRARSQRERIDPPPPDLGRALGDLGRALTDERIGGMRARVARSVIGWLPIAFGVGWAIGELTGCGRFAATCDGATGPFVLLIQGLLLALLLLVPALASIATIAAMSLLGAAVVASLVLSATGGVADTAARQVTLGSVLLISWLTGFVVAVIRRVRELPSRGRPVS